MPLQTRRPTGEVAWPMILLAGAEKAGKTFAAAEASASDLVDRTLWFGYGEDDPDEYAAIPGADFEIVGHDGTYRGLRSAMEEALREPQDKPTLWNLDSGSQLWAWLSDEQQQAANRRRDKKAARSGRGGQPQGDKDDEAQITVDLWNIAKDRWQHILSLCKQHHGPTIITSRLELVNVVENGQPTGEKVWKIKAEKNTPYDAGVVIQMRAFGDVYLTGVRSLRIDRPPTAESRLGYATPGRGYKPLIDTLWRNLGLADGKVKIAAVTRPGGIAVPDPDADPDVTSAQKYADRIINESLWGNLDALKKAWGDVPAELSDVTVQVPDAEGTMTGRSLKDWYFYASTPEAVKAHAEKPAEPARKPSSDLPNGSEHASVRVPEVGADPVAADVDDAADPDDVDVEPDVCPEEGCTRWANHDGPHTLQEALA